MVVSKYVPAKNITFFRDIFTTFFTGNFLPYVQFNYCTRAVMLNTRIIADGGRLI
jgi:hypothetical protein